MSARMPPVHARPGARTLEQEESWALRPAVSRDVARRLSAPAPAQPGYDIGRIAVYPRPQAKLEVSEPGDEREQEADRVADAVMRMPEPGPGEEEEEEEEAALEAGGQEEAVLTKAEGGSTTRVDSDTATRIRSLEGGGEALPHSVRTFFEPRLGHDLSRVRVHHDPESSRLASRLRARAFTVGGDIVFAPGQYRPSSATGGRLLAHELAHVIQQGAGGHRAVQRKEAQGISGQKKYDTPGRDVLWLDPRLKFLMGVLNGFSRAAGGGLTPEANEKAMRDLTDPRRVAAVFAGYHVGVPEGELESLKDNVVGLAQIAELAFWMTPHGIMLRQIKEAYEWARDPEGKRAEAAERREKVAAVLEELKDLAQRLAKDPGVVADLGEEFGEAAGRQAATWYSKTFADAQPFEKGRMLGRAVGYLLMEVALGMLSPGAIAAKAPAIIPRLARLQRLLRTVRTTARTRGKATTLRRALRVVNRLSKGPISKWSRLRKAWDVAIVDCYGSIIFQANKFGIAHRVPMNMGEALRVAGALPTQESRRYVFGRVREKFFLRCQEDAALAGELSKAFLLRGKRAPKLRPELISGAGGRPMLHRSAGVEIHHVEMLANYGNPIDPLNVQILVGLRHRHYPL